MNDQRTVHRASSLLALAFALSASSCGAPEDVAPLTRAPSTAGRKLFGAFVPHAVWRRMRPARRLERRIGRDLDVIHWFLNWNDPFNPAIARRAARRGRRVLISWQSTDRPLARITAGDYDDYIERWARAVRDYRDPVYLRLFPEMNGSWTSWNRDAMRAGGAPALVRAWRHVVARFRAQGATNARWVWTPNATDSRIAGHQNRLEDYYPGSDVVDVLGFDGYNWGTSQRPDSDGKGWKSEWQSFTEMARDPYRRVTALDPDKPLWIAETGSVEQGGDKGAWLCRMWRDRSLPRITGIIWFDMRVPTNRKTGRRVTDWRIESTRQTLAAARRCLGDSN